MVRDETILDGVGVVLILVAVVAFATGVLRGAPILGLLEGISPLALGGIAAIAGVGGVLAFLKNR